MGITITIDEKGMTVRASSGSAAEVQEVASLLAALAEPLDRLRERANQFYDDLDARPLVGKY